MKGNDDSEAKNGLYSIYVKGNNYMVSKLNKYLSLILVSSYASVRIMGTAYYCCLSDCHLYWQCQWKDTKMSEFIN